MAVTLGRFVLGRAALLVLTLGLVSVLVFAAAQVLPGDVGRAVLGPLADERAVAAVNHRLGTDRPVVVQYLGWLSGALRGDLGTSLAMRAPVTSLLGPALRHSATLALVALVLVVPAGVGAGILAGFRAGTALDRVIILASVSLATVPDFVSALLLIMVFGLWLEWFPISGTPAGGSGAWAGVHALILPALPLVLVFGGYLARMARAGVVEAIGADYTRTAVLKGLPTRTVLLVHVLPNALMPTIAVISAQFGYFLGGLVVIESLFHVGGLGSLVMSAAKSRDFPLLEGGVMVMATVYAVGATAGDLLQALLDPRLRRARPR